MTENQKAAFVNSQVCCAGIKAMAMAADNRQKLMNHEYPIYGYEDFENIIGEFGIGSNDVIHLFHE